MFPSGRQRINRLYGALFTVAAVVGLAHWPVLRCQALWFDDDLYLSDNPLIQNPGLDSAGQMLSEVLHPSIVRGYYHPLTLISLMADYAAGGRSDNLVPFHRTSLLLHVASSVLVTWLFWLLFRRAAIAALVGLAFGLHPTAVETVAWLGARKAVLAGFFCFWSLALYVLFVRRHSRAAYLASIAAYALALLSKPTSIPLPAMLVLLDVWPLQRFSRKTLVEKIPIFLAGGVFVGIAVASHLLTSSLSVPEDRSISQALLLMAYKFMLFIRMTVSLPQAGTFHARPAEVAFSNPAIAASLMGCMILIGVALAFWRRIRAPAVGLAVLFVGLLPMLGAFQYGADWVFAFDNYLYLPILGPLLILAWLMRRLGFMRFARRSAGREESLLILLISVAVAELGYTTRCLGFWKTSTSLAQRMVSTYPDVAVLQCQLGIALAAEGRTDEAIDAYKAALQLDPKHVKAHYTLANAYMNLRRNDDAIHHYEEVLRLSPGYGQARNNLGTMYLYMGRLEDAAMQFQEALVDRPYDHMVYNNLGLVLAKLGRYPEAIAAYNKALQWRGDDMKAHKNLAQALVQVGRIQEGIEHYEIALRLEPNWPEVRMALDILREVATRSAPASVEHFPTTSAATNDATVHSDRAAMLGQQGQLDAALGECRAALEIEPRHLGAHINMGHVLGAMGRRAEALDAYKTAAEIAPDDPRPHYALALELESQGLDREAIEEYETVVRLDAGFMDAGRRLRGLRE